MDIPVIKPRVYSRSLAQNLQELLGGEQGYSDGSNSFVERTFVKLASGVLASATTIAAGPTASAAGDVFLGYTYDASDSGGVVNPPYVMRPGRHFPLALTGMRFLMNITDASFNIGEANGAPDLAEVTIGTSYELIVGGSSTPGTGEYEGVFAVNVDATTNAKVKVVDIPNRVDTVSQLPLASAYNGWVVVEFLPAALQLGL